MTPDNQLAGTVNDKVLARGLTNYGERHVRALVTPRPAAPERGR
jgi:hypothetical protein